MFRKSVIRVIYIAVLLLLLVNLHPLTRSLEAIGRSPDPANGQAPLLQNHTTTSNLSTVSAPLPSLIVIDPGHGGDDPGAPSVVANSYDAASAVRGMEIHIYDLRKYTNPKYPGIPAAAKVSPQSKKIAKSIVEHIESHPTNIPVRRLTGQADGIRYDADYLLRLNPIPSALIELGYLSNPLDAKLLTDSDVQDLYAKDIADGIAEAVPEKKADEATDQRNAS